MDLGNLRIDSVLDGTSRFRPTKTFRATTDEEWETHQDLLDEDGLLGFSVGSFLVRNGTHTALVDLGAGRRQVLGVEGGALLDSLAALGLGPDDITDVIFTHLHLDHVGWATDEEHHVVFPNATYRCHQADWQHYMVENPGDVSEVLDGARDRFETFDGDGVLLPGIDTLAAPGHTPGSTVIVVSSGTDRALLLGDVVHCPIQLVDDEWSALFDFDLAQARRTRNALARELEDGTTLAAAAHFPGLQLGRLIRSEGRRRWVV